VVSLADTLARAHRHEAADAALAAAIDAGDAELELRVARARLAERRGRTDLALRHWQRVLAVAPEHAETRLGIVRALRGEGRSAEAEARCWQLLASMPKDPRPFAEHARIALDGGDPVEAESRWHGALLAHPGNAAALLGLAQALTAQHRFEDARRLLETMGHDGRAGRDALVALARTHLAEGDLDGAEGRVRQLLAVEPERVAHRLLLGRLLELRSEHGQAGELCAALASGHPQAPEPRLAAAELVARQGNLEGARDGFLAVLALDPIHLDALVGLASAMAELGHAEEADAAAARALAVAPNQPKAHLCRAAVAELEGRLDAARLALLEARSAMPHREEPLRQLAQLALRHGQLEVAAGHADALLALHPRSVHVRLTAFDVVIAGQRSEAAREVLAGLAGELPEHREVQRRLARLDWLDGAVERARSRWARITRHDPRLHGGPDLVARLDPHALPPAAGEVRVFMLVRNEAARLPWLLGHYRGLGVDRFLSWS
jgi:predicted Zn-dependent protease